MHEVKHESEAHEAERWAIEWEQKHGGDAEFERHCWKNAPWDDSY